MLEIVIEIGTEQTRLFESQCTLFHDVESLDVFVTEIIIDFSDRAMFVLKNSGQNRQESFVERTWLFHCTPIPVC